jgi:hypothetical protein
MQVMQATGLTDQQQYQKQGIFPGKQQKKGRLQEKIYVKR